MSVAKQFNRGIVIPPPIFQEGSSFSSGSQFDNNAARFAALYFDRALLVGNQMIHFGDVVGADALVSRRFATRHLAKYNFMNYGMVEGNRLLSVAQIEDGLLSLPASHRSKWSTFYPSMPEVPKQLQDEYNCIFIDLFSGFPCPTSDVSIDKILAFNAKNRNALHSLRLGVSRFAERLTLARNEPAILDAVQTELTTNLETLERELQKAASQG